MFYGKPLDSTVFHPLYCRVDSYYYHFVGWNNTPSGDFSFGMRCVPPKNQLVLGGGWPLEKKLRHSAFRKAVLSEV